MPAADEPFDPASLLERLATADVDFVLIGAVAGGAHGSSYGTFDVDIALADEPANFRRLAAVLTEVESDRPFAAPASEHRTNFGRLKAFTAPAGAPPYQVLKDAALRITLRGRCIRVASLDHLIAMKARGARTRDKLIGMEYRTISDELRAPRDA